MFRVRFFALLLVLLSLFLIAARPLQADLSETQFIIVGVVAVAAGAAVSLVTQVVLVVASLLKKPIDKDKTKQVVLTIVGSLCSLYLAFTWAKPVFPAIPPPGVDPLAFTNALLLWIGEAAGIAVGLVGLAHIVYRSLLQQVVYPVVPFLRRV